MLLQAGSKGVHFEKLSQVANLHSLRSSDARIWSDWDQAWLPAKETHAQRGELGFAHRLPTTSEASSAGVSKSPSMFTIGRRFPRAWLHHNLASLAPLSTGCY